MKQFFLSCLAVILLIEEWIWDVLSLFGHFLAEHLGFIKFENWLQQASPYQALIAIAIPLLIVTPINITAFWLLAHGLILQGIALEIAAKLLGTLFVARFFTLTKQQLLTFRVIAKIYNAITTWLRWAHEKITATAAYRWLKAFKATLKSKIAVWLAKLRQILRL